MKTATAVQVAQIEKEARLEECKIIDAGQERRQRIDHQHEVAMFELRKNRTPCGF